MAHLCALVVAQMLTETVRAETERDMTFRPQLVSKRSKAMTAGYGDFLDEMRVRDMSREEHMQRLRATLQEEERKDFTFKPKTRGASKSREAQGGSPRGGSPAAALPVHDRLYQTRTAALDAALNPMPPSDRECTFHPSLKPSVAKRDATAKEA
eukprot:4836875-Pleurochrysis_carterae.AAC.1